MLVYVLNKHGKPLMPCQPQRARSLLCKKKARVVQRVPFTIQLLFGSSGYKQTITAGMDSGSRHIGSAAVAQGQVVYQSVIQLRGEEIKGKLTQKRMYRRNRRSRKTGYRKPRFLNRRASIQTGRLPPSIRHKIQAHLKEKQIIESLLPVSDWNVELARFDIHAITDPHVTQEPGSAYQRGKQYGFENLKAYILHRDQHQCQACKGKSKDPFLHVHHLIFRSRGGTDTPGNLITLCKTCHSQVHAGELDLGRKKFPSITKHATEISVVASQLRKIFGFFKETFGFETKIKRRKLNLPKEHYLDAVAICLSEGETVDLSSSVYRKRKVSQGDYQQTSGAHSEKKIPTGKLFGLRKFDLIETSQGIGFVKGKRSSGYFAISTIDGKPICNSTPVKTGIKRIRARTTTLIIREAAIPLHPNTIVMDGVSLPKTG